MRIWLDDERDPTDSFIQNEFGAAGDEVWCKTVEQAEKLIKQGNVTYISFDHDLGGDNPNGYQLAKWIEEQAFQQTITKINWRIHTQNPIGYKNIMTAMMNADKYWQIKES